ncbi:MAG: molybdopterin-binding protein, partial [Syntrophales bacterium]
MSNERNHHLLRKTELHISGISLKNADLNEIASVISKVLGLSEREILVTNVQDNFVTIDILRSSVDPGNIVGKKKMLLQRLSEIEGVHVSDAASLHSDGMLGWIEADAQPACDALRHSENMVNEIGRRVKMRAIVFSTGQDVSNGQIKDTNTPLIKARLEKIGYSVSSGEPLKDDEELISGFLRKAIHGGGYGLVITTGGVGAEDKDRTIEAILLLDPQAAVFYTCKFEAGTGRHVKDGVRVAVGTLSDTLIVALPGPNDEVNQCLDILV